MHDIIIVVHNYIVVILYTLVYTAIYNNYIIMFTSLSDLAPLLIIDM